MAGERVGEGEGEGEGEGGGRGGSQAAAGEGKSREPLSDGEAAGVEAFLFLFLSILG